MTVFYFQNKEERNNKEAEIKNKDFLIVTTEAIDKDGKTTTGKSGRIIYDTKNNVKESSFYKFTRTHSYIYRELSALLNFSQLYPEMYNVFEKHQQDDIKKETGAEKIDFTNSFGIYQARIAMFRKNLGQEGMRYFQPQEIDEKLLSYSIFKEFLPKSLDFVKEVSLNYIISLFEIYVSRITEAVLESSIKSNLISTDKITSDFVRNITRSPESMKKLMKEVFDFDIVDEK